MTHTVKRGHNWIALPVYHITNYYPIVCLTEQLKRASSHWWPTQIRHLFIQWQILSWLSSLAHLWQSLRHLIKCRINYTLDIDFRTHYWMTWNKHLDCLHSCLPKPTPVFKQKLILNEEYSSQRRISCCDKNSIPFCRRIYRSFMKNKISFSSHICRPWSKESETKDTKFGAHVVSLLTKIILYSMIIIFDKTDFLRILWNKFSNINKGWNLGEVQCYLLKSFRIYNDSEEYCPHLNYHQLNTYYLLNLDAKN